VTFLRHFLTQAANAGTVADFRVGDIGKPDGAVNPFLEVKKTPKKFHRYPAMSTNETQVFRKVSLDPIWVSRVVKTLERPTISGICLYR
jgi:hypothetical protein